MISRHKGTIISLGSRCVVVFRELPNDPAHCLVVESDTLPEVYSDAFVSVVNNEGQRSKDLFEVLQHSMMPTGEVMLSALHRNGLLRKKECSNILMQPTPEYTIRLDELNKNLRLVEEPEIIKSQDIQNKFNPYDPNASISNFSESPLIAQKLLNDYKFHKEEAKKFFDRAVTLDPSIAETVNIDGIEVEALKELMASTKKVNSGELVNIKDIEGLDESIALGIYNTLKNRFQIDDNWDTPIGHILIKLKDETLKDINKLVKDSWI